MMAIIYNFDIFCDCETAWNHAAHAKMSNGLNNEEKSIGSVELRIYI